MSIDELEKLCEPNPMENRHDGCFPAHLAKKLIAVARAAQGMFGPKPFISYLQTQRVVQLERNKLKEALAELEKS